MDCRYNKYIDSYIDNYVKHFRNFVTSKYTINISGLADFISADDHDVAILTNKLQLYNFDLST